MPHPYLQAARERWFNPYKRYQYSRLIHAVRLGLAVIAATLLALVFSIPAAYALSRYRFRGKGLYRNFLLMTQMM